MFSTLNGTYFSFQVHFKMLSAICFNFCHSKRLLSGNGLKVVLMVYFSLIGLKARGKKSEFWLPTISPFPTIYAKQVSIFFF